MWPLIDASIKPVSADDEPLFQNAIYFAIVMIAFEPLARCRFKTLMRLVCGSPTMARNEHKFFGSFF
jgi:hypothetical protein